MGFLSFCKVFASFSLLIRLDCNRNDKWKMELCLKVNIMNVQSEDGQYKIVLSFLDCSQWGKYCNQCNSLCTSHTLTSPWMSHTFTSCWFKEAMTLWLSSGGGYKSCF